MPDREWPPLQRRAGRAVGGVIYASCAIAGAAVVIWPPYPVRSELSDLAGAALGVLACLAGFAGLVALLRGDWHMEWVAAAFVAAAFGGYAVVDWGQAITDGPQGIAGAAALTFAWGCAVRRWLELWAFSLRTNRARRVRRRFEEGR